MVRRKKAEFMQEATQTVFEKENRDWKRKGSKTGSRGASSSRAAQRQKRKQACESPLAFKADRATWFHSPPGPRAVANEGRQTRRMEASALASNSSTAKPNDDNDGSEEKVGGAGARMLHIGRPPSGRPGRRPSRSLRRALGKSSAKADIHAGDSIL